MSASDVNALIQAAGHGTRLGLGPKAFVSLGERTLLERAVETMASVASHVIVAVPREELARARNLVGTADVSVIPGGERRSDTFRRLVDGASAPWLMLHDIAHPFVTVDLSLRVLAAARVHNCAAAALPVAEFIYRSTGDICAGPGEALVVQKPVAFELSAIVAALKISRQAGEGRDLGILEVLAYAGVRARFVIGSLKNIKLTDQKDLHLAERLVRSAID